MARGPELETRRLILRRWRKDDLLPLAALNGDPEVMEFLPTTLDQSESARLMARFEYLFKDHGYGVWAVEVAWAKAVIGFCGLAPVEFDASFTPAVEVGWRLARKHWGNGYATESARATLEFAFTEAELDEVVSFTVVDNERSWKVMESIGMTRDGEFDHPNLMDDDRLRRHVLYRITADQWANRAKT